MPDLILTALITTVGGAIGGLVVAVVGPFMQDRNASRAERRASEKQRAVDRRQRIERVGELLRMTSPMGDATSTAEAGYRELPTAVAAVDDPPLASHVGRMLSSPRGGGEWEDAYGDARHRVGQLLSQL